MAEQENQVTEFRLRSFLVGVFVVFIFIAALTILPELLRQSIPIDYEKAGLNLAIGFSIGMLIGVWLARRLETLTQGLIVTVPKSWRLDIGFGLLIMCLAGIPALMAQSCHPSWESQASRSAAMECLMNAWMAARLTDGFILGVLLWIFGWTLMQERNRKGQLLIAVHSARQWTIRGWPVRNTVLGIGFGIFLLYIFYRIFSLGNK